LIFVKNIFKVFTLAFVLLITSVSSIASTVFNAEELEQRVKARWETIVKHEFGSTYQYETPTYKAVFAKNLYVNQFSYGVDWTLTSVESVKYDEATGVATVVVDVKTMPRNSKGLDAKVKTASIKIHEKWLHIKGRWWHSSSE